MRTLEYKAEINFIAKGFNADRGKFYESVRQKVAVIYKEHHSFFGPERTAFYPFPGRDGSPQGNWTGWKGEMGKIEKVWPRADQT